MKTFYSCAITFMVVSAAVAAGSDLEQQILDLEQQFRVATAAEESPAVLQNLKEQVGGLYAQRPENQPRRQNPLDQGSDLCPGVHILSLPFTDTGTTAGYENNYGPPVPCNTSNAPDVVYYYTPEYTGMHTVSLCGSSYDTYLYVVDGFCTLTQVACNDDACGLSSEVTFMATVGHAYTIFVDGFGAQSGAYVFNMWDACDVTYQPGDQVECTETQGPEHQSTDCSGGFCNSVHGGVDTFTEIVCGQSCFARLFSYYVNGNNIRDFDWYRFTISEPCTVRVRAISEWHLGIQLGQVEACADQTYSVEGDACEWITLAPGCLPAGTYWYWVTTASSAQNPAIRDYRVTLECTPCAGVPNVPDGLVVRYSSQFGWRVLNWAPVLTDTYGNPVDVTRYTIYRSTDQVVWDSIGVPAPPDTTVFVDPTATDARSFYEVRAVAE